MGELRLITVAVLGAFCRLSAPAIGFAASLTPEQQQRLTALEGKLLAPCCYEEPVARHQSEVALRMRLEIARWVEEGRTEREIIDSYVERYGGKVVANYAPTPSWAQYVPWLLSGIGAAFVAWLIRRMVRPHAASESQTG